MPSNLSVPFMTAHSSQLKVWKQIIYKYIAYIFIYEKGYIIS